MSEEHACAGMVDAYDGERVVEAGYIAPERAARLLARLKKMPGTNMDLKCKIAFKLRAASRKAP